MTGLFTLTWQAIMALILSLLLILSNVADAGHPAWETSRVEHPEWLSYELYPKGTRYWPNKKIKYTFYNDHDARILRPLLQSAHALWLAAGLPDEFKLEELGNSNCAGQGPTGCLRIYRGQDVFNTPIGRQTSIRNTGRTAGREEPLRAYWSENPRIGYNSALANIAHELGHAWGLLHEQQNRAYWWGRDDTNRIFDFKCENLFDYREIVINNRLTHDQIFNPETGICVDAQAAAKYKFSAADWLPWMGHRLYYSEHTHFPQLWDVDLYSLMLYPSYLGSKTGSDDGNINAAVYVWSPIEHDRWIYKNLAPSAMDIQGLKTIYGHTWPVPAPQLLNDRDSPYNAMFRVIAPGCGSS